MILHIANKNVIVN